MIRARAGAMRPFVKISLTTCFITDERLHVFTVEMFGLRQQNTTTEVIHTRFNV